MNKTYLLNNKRTVVLCELCANLAYDTLIFTAKRIKDTKIRNQAVFELGLEKLQGIDTNSPCQGTQSVYSQGHPCLYTKAVEYAEDMVYLVGTCTLQNFTCFFDPVAKDYNEHEYRNVPIYSFKINTHHACTQNLISKETLVEETNNGFPNENYKWNLCSTCLCFLGPLWIFYAKTAFQLDDESIKVINDALERLMQDAKTEEENSSYSNFGVCSYGNCRAEYIMSLPNPGEPFFKEKSKELALQNIEKMKNWEQSFLENQELMYPQYSKETLKYFSKLTSKTITSVISKTN